MQKAILVCCWDDRIFFVFNIFKEIAIIVGEGGNFVPAKLKNIQVGCGNVGVQSVSNCVQFYQI